MCPRTRSILVAMTMLVVSLLAATLIANLGRSGADPGSERAVLRKSQVVFSQRTQQSAAGNNFASSVLLR